MNILFYCNTYMQLINSVNLRMTVYKHDNVDLAISDHSSNSEVVFENLKKQNLFSNVIYLKTKKYIYPEPTSNRATETLSILKRDNKYKNVLWSNTIHYDSIIYFNIDFILWLICIESIRNGNRPVLVRMEEGVFSYPTLDTLEGGSLKALSVLSKVKYNFDLFKETKSVAVYYPQLYDNPRNLNVITIPLLSRANKDLLEVLNHIFGYNYREYCYKEKYLYFSSSTDVDGYHVNEAGLVINLANKLGKDNFIIKTHPRDLRSIYLDNGLRVMKASFIPWEIIQLNNAFNGKEFITLSSGSVINASLMLGDNNKTLFIYPLVHGLDERFDKKMGNEIYYNIKKIKNAGFGKNISILNQINSI